MQVVSRASMPRVAFVTGGLKLGGTTTFLCNLAGELIRRGIVCQVFSFEKENPLASDFQRLNIPVQVWDERRLIFEDRLNQILLELAAFQPTVVMANLGPASFEILRYVPPGLLRVGLGQSDDGIVYDTIRLYASHLDLVAVVSRTMKEKMLALPELARLPVHYLPYGVPLPDDPKATRPDANLPLRILYLGRLEQEQKRVQLFPKILEQLCASSLSFHWTIAGDGPEMAFLKENMKTRLPLQTVTFSGSVRYADVPSVLREQDVFLLASDYEGLPLSLLEAMGNGVVPVVSDLKSGIPEVVNQDNGVLVPVSEVAGYAEAIIHLNEHRDELAAKSAAARARVQKEFSVAAMTDRWLAVFPPAPTSPSVWPQRWKIAAPMSAKSPAFFSPPMRFIRRLARKLQTFWK